MVKLFLLRHMKSVWNEENRFTGWTNVPLNKKGIKNAEKIAKKIFKFKIDKIYTSNLFRNQDTVARIIGHNNRYPIFINLDESEMQNKGNYTKMNKNEFPVYVTKNLNERYYGKLQGENKESTMKKYGKEKVQLWRRSYDIAPPGGESLKDVEKRTIPFFNKYIKKELNNGNNVLIVSSHNSLRIIIKNIEKISNTDIIKTEVPYGGLIEYNFKKNSLNKLELINKKNL